jgi:hypothetical protein
MPAQPDCKHTALLTNTGESSGHVDDLEQLWLETETGTTGHVNDLWMLVFQANGATSDDWNTAAKQFLLDVDVTDGALPDMWTEFWCDKGGILPVLDEVYEVELADGLVNYQVDLAATVDYEVTIGT